MFNSRVLILLVFLSLLTSARAEFRESVEIASCWLEDDNFKRIKGTEKEIQDAMFVFQVEHKDERYEYRVEISKEDTGRGVHYIDMYVRDIKSGDQATLQSYVSIDKRINTSESGKRFSTLYLAAGRYDSKNTVRLNCK